jgi:hypothetical protein
MALLAGARSNGLACLLPGGGAVRLWNLNQFIPQLQYQPSCGY